MTFFANISIDQASQEKDTLGGFSLLDSDIYTATIKHAYGSQTQKGGVNLNVEFDIDGHTHKETLFVANERQESFFTTQTGEKKPYPSFLLAESIALLGAGKTLAQLKTEPKVINIYNYEQQKDIPTQVPMFTELLGKQVKVAILKELVNKKTKQGNEYVDTAETKEVNKLDKVFSMKGDFTVAELRQKEETAKFYQQWLDKNKGQTKDKTNKKLSATSTPQAGSVASLFN